MARSMQSASWGADTTHGSGTISPYGRGGREMQQSGDAAEEPDLDTRGIEKITSSSPAHGGKWTCDVIASPWSTGGPATP